MLWDRTLFFLIQAKVLTSGFVVFLKCEEKSPAFLLSVEDPYVFPCKLFNEILFQLWFPLFIYVRSNIRPNVDARAEMCVFVLFVMFA